MSEQPKDITSIKLSKANEGMIHLQRALYLVAQELEFDRYITCTINTGTGTEFLIGTRKVEEKKNDSV
jgi:hypothetical protein